MRYEYRLPDIGEGIAEAELVGWHVKPGDRVEDGTMLADIMTDKATVEIEAPVSGVITEQYRRCRRYGRDRLGAAGDRDG